MNASSLRQPAVIARLIGGTIAAALALTAIGATTAHRRSNGRFDGEAVPLGNGTARSYVILEGGRPTEIGIALSEDALEGLSAAPTAPGAHAEHGGQGEHPFMEEYLLPLPKEAATTPYRLVELDWNPAGHHPPGIYDRPHFDFHFYTIDEAARNAIDPADPQFAARAERFPAPELVPAGYISPMANLTAPRMGRHWFHPAAPELNGQPFTHTFIYGTWDGRLIFGEPMITHAFLASRASVQVPVATAERHEPAGYYPTHYGIHFDAVKKEYRIALQSLVHRG